jgi:hypothetical protein
MYFAVHGQKLVSCDILCKATNRVLPLVADDGVSINGPGCKVIAHVVQTAAVCVDMRDMCCWVMKLVMRMLQALISWARMLHHAHGILEEKVWRDVCENGKCVPFQVGSYKGQGHAWAFMCDNASADVAGL